MNTTLFRRRLVASLQAILLLGLVSAAPTQAQGKIATVDLRKLFEGYYKTKQADTQLRDRGADAEKQYKTMVDEYTKANEEYKKLVESANDQAVSSEERDRRKKSAEAKVLELNDIEKNLTQFKREKQATFDEQKKRMRDQIVREIRDVINNKARTAGYDMILDNSAESMNGPGAPILLYNNGQNDLTDQILKQLNVGAPPGSLDDDKSTRGDIKLGIPETDQGKEKPAKKR